MIIGLLIGAACGFIAGLWIGVTVANSPIIDDRDWPDWYW